MLVISSIFNGETPSLKGVFHLSIEFVNVIGDWKNGLEGPTWLMTNL